MTPDFIPFPAYKDSGFDWLGDVPEHWEVLPGRACFHEKKQPNLGLQEETVLSLSYGRIVVKPPEKLHGLVPSSFESYQIVNPLDIVIRPTDLQNDWNSLRFGLSRHRGIITSAYLCFQTKNTVTPGFGHLLLHSYDLMKVFYGLGSGLRQNLDWSDFKHLPCSIPPLPEQAAIVRFLDHADRYIQRYIRAKQKLIALLEEQKRAIINEAVTGRIDVRTGRTYPAYKDSGVEWLGEVPEHWKWCRLRNVVSLVTTGSRGWSSYASDTGPLFIRVANLSRGALKLRFDDVVRLNLPDTSEAQRTRIKAGDLLISVTAYIGSVGVVPEELEEAYVSQHVARCQPSPGSCSQWIGYVLLSMIGQTHGQISLYGGTKDGLSLDDVKNYPILLPPRIEQDQAVRWIESNLSTLVRAGESAKRQIEKVREFRNRLIADVVTGKLDVRAAAAEPPEEYVLRDAEESAEEYTNEIL